MRLEFTDVDGNEGVVHGDPWGLIYDGPWKTMVQRGVDMYEEVAVRVPVRDDHPAGIKINAHTEEDAPVETRLRMLKRHLYFNPYVGDLEVIIDQS